ncbi:hypothetical protein HYPSUDRAFT_337870 [Hypholoma sublateritium FD-334 SS-4]|uniref:Uncharacterized protein n=1 Tax=Hypholoma sublateritium (strain FD-334 SS-4) TaxID=945553 RepID=A0A0D2NGH3_HYPSF|nr:hypothetical protein HYPSUDRAFT_337870 [Hypholoma sublateritium FD-334 SS-4]
MREIGARTAHTPRFSHREAGHLSAVGDQEGGEGPRRMRKDSHFGWARGGGVGRLLCAIGIGASLRGRAALHRRRRGARGHGAARCRDAVRLGVREFLGSSADDEGRTHRPTHTSIALDIGALRYRRSCMCAFGGPRPVVRLVRGSMRELARLDGFICVGTGVRSMCIRAAVNG